MNRMIPLLMLIVLVVVACDKKAAPAARTQKDPKITAIEDRVAKTTPEGKAVIETVLAMKPEVNEQVSTKTLQEMVDDYAKNKGAYNINSIGWEASQKKTGRWKVVFNYQDWQKQLLAAEWEYDTTTKKVYPFERDNAPGFWSNEGAEPVKKGKK